MRRLIGCVVGLALMAEACGGNEPVPPPQEATNTSPTPSGPAVVDPLEGTWRQDYSCQQQVSTFIRKIRASTPATLQNLADLKHLASANPSVIIQAFVAEFSWGPNADTANASTPEARCEGAPDRSKIMRVQDGSMAFVVRDPSRRGDVGTEMVATYEVVDDHTFTATDGDRDLNATETFSFTIEGNRLTIKQIGKTEQDAWAGTAFEMAPFVRIG